MNSIELLPGSNKNGKSRLDTPEGCREYFRDRFKKFIKKDFKNSII